MSRVAKSPVPLPKGVEVTLSAQQIQVKGAKGSLSQALHGDVEVVNDNGVLRVGVREETASDRR